MPDPIRTSLSAAPAASADAGGVSGDAGTWLRTERLLPKARRRTACRLFEGLQAEGYRGAYDSVQRLVQRWKAARSGPALTQAFVPLAFAPGEVCQFDWSHEHVELAGVMQTIKVAHFRLAFSRQMFVVACPRETQERVFDARNRAFAFFGGVPQRMVHDNLKAVVETILTGQERLFNRRCMVLANPYLSLALPADPATQPSSRHSIVLCTTEPLAPSAGCVVQWRAIA